MSDCTAIILAAGLGSRIPTVSEHCPKGFLELEGLSLIERSVQSLLAAGIKRVVIGVGYKKEFYERLAQRYTEIECVFSPDFRTTGSFETFKRATKNRAGSILLLESDIIYEPRAIHELLDHERDDVLLASGLSHSFDEVYIEACSQHYLKNMGKDKAKLGHVYGELVGMTRLSAQTIATMNELDSSEVLDYETALIQVGNVRPVFVHKVEDLLWSEVDCAFHHERLLNDIWPKLKREGS